jgi:hypothetical protein
MLITIAALLCFLAAVTLFAITLAVQSDPSELEFFLGLHFLLIGWTLPFLVIGIRRCSLSRPTLVIFGSVFFMVLNGPFLAHPHWRYPPKWTGGQCYGNMSNPSNETGETEPTCLLVAYLSPVLSQCDIQRGILRNSNISFAIEFADSQVMANIPLSLVEPYLLLDECSFYCGKAQFYPRTHCGPIMVTRTQRQDYVNRDFNYFMIFLPLLATSICVYVWLIQQQQRALELERLRRAKNFDLALV